MPNRKCLRCNKPIRGLAELHTWCAELAGRAARDAADRDTADEEAFIARLKGSHVGVQTAPPMPIRRAMEVPMPQAKANIAKLPTKSSGPTFDQIVLVAREYETFKAEAERIEKELAKRNAFLKEALVTLPGMRVPVTGQDLGLVSNDKVMFDLAAAKKKKTLAPLLKPYIEMIEKFDLKAAQKHLDDATLKPFITVEESFSLRFLKAKE